MTQRMVSAEAKEALYDKPVEHIIDDGKEEMDYCFTKMMLGEKVNDTDEEIVEAVKKTSVLDMIDGKPIESYNADDLALINGNQVKNN